MSSSDNIQNLNQTSQNDTVKKPYVTYILIAVFFVIMIAAWLVLLYIMYTGEWGLFPKGYQRPIPDDPNLVSVNGELVELTAEEQQRFSEKIRQALEGKI